MAADPNCPWAKYPFMGTGQPFCKACGKRFQCWPIWCDRCKRPICMMACNTRGQ